MNKILRTALNASRIFGFDAERTGAVFRHAARYFREWRRFEQLNRPDLLPMGRAFPIFHDYDETAGAASGHYFHMDLWAARKIFQANPARHLDVGSRIDGFIAHLLAFRSVDVIDIRPIESNVDGLNFVQGDATDLHGIPDNSVESLSCLHAAEHFGLGRYGDPIDPAAYRNLLDSLSRVLAPGGRLYFAVPIGRERVEFNAHRIFDPNRIVRELPGLTLVEFSAVNDSGDFVRIAQPEDFASAHSACGLYEFSKSRPENCR